MKKIHCHVDEVEWQQLDDQDWKAFRYKELLNRNRGGCNEFIFGYGEIDPGQCVPLHIHKSELAVNFISGKARVQLGKRSVSLDANSGAFFPGKVPHSIEAISKETLGFIYTYACHENNQYFDRQTVDNFEADKYDILNKTKTRWAVSEDFEVWEPVELSKGFKLRSRYLFDNSKGNTKNMCVSMFDIDGGCHYTDHYHSDPEIYYIISGHGTMRVANETVTLAPGTAVYLEPSIIHGVDSIGDEPLHTMVIFMDKVIDEWTPVEDIYTDIRNQQ